MKIEFGKVGALLIVGVLLLCSSAFAEPVAAPPAKPVSSKPVKVPTFDEMERMFYRAADLFHAVEGEYSAGGKSHPAKPADFPRFKAAAQAAEKYLDAAVIYESTAAPSVAPLTGVPVANYIAAMSWYSAQNYERALHFIEQMLEQYGDYRRPRMYIGDEADEDTMRPIVDNLLLLKMDIKARQGGYDKIADPIAALNEIMADAKGVLAARRRWHDEIRNHRLRDLLMGWEGGGSTSDMARVRVLPSLQENVEAIHDKLLPLAVEKSGARAIKAYLKAGAQPDQPFSKYFAAKLLDIDRILIAGLKQQAESALGQKKYDEAKNALRQLRAEYGESEEIKAYTFANLNKVALGFKDEGDSAYNTQVIKPQTESYTAYQKVLEVEDAEPVLKGYAYYRMAAAAGTMGKYQDGIAHLDQAIAIWNAMTPEQRPAKTADVNQPRKAWGASLLYYIEDAYYYRAHFYGFGLKQRDKGIELMNEIMQKFPDSIYVCECLWNNVLLYRWSGRSKEAAAACRVLIAKCPDSVRAENARGLLEMYYKKY